MTSRLSVFTPSNHSAVVITGSGWSKKPARNWGMPANQFWPVTAEQVLMYGDGSGRSDPMFNGLADLVDFTPTGGKR